MTKGRKLCVVVPRHYEKEKKGQTYLNMRVMWVIFCGVCVCRVGYAAESFSAVGAPVCGYGMYRQNGTCYDYDDENDTICQGRNISGTSCLNQFVNTSSEIDGLYPFDAGFSAIGAPMTTYTTMRDNDCLGTMDGYYAVSMNKFAKLSNYKCTGTMTPYEILNDCQNIDMSITDATDTRSPLHPDNFMCGVLCDAGFIYTATGACSQYCTFNGKVQRLHILRDGEQIDFPLYTDALTTPAVHIRFSDENTCHLNLSTESATDVLNINYKGKRYYSTK